MFYIFWALLNTAFAIYFIAICFKATRLLKENFGRFTSIIFVFGLLSFSGCFNHNDISDNNKTKNFVSDDSLSKSRTIFLEVELANNLISKYNLEIVYGKDNHLQNIPLSGYATTTGFICATNWKPVNIIVERTDNNNKFRYSVFGTVEWKLLGLTVYTQGKNYNGFVFTTNAKSSSFL